MAYEINFGKMTAAESAPIPKKGRKFRLAVLGDFSARANRGELETGDALAERKPLKAEADNLDDLLERLSPKLNIELPGSGTVELEFTSMQDFHPDALYEKLEIFSKLSGLRGRLKNTSTFAKAAKEMSDIGLAAAPAHAKKRVKARGAVIATGAKLSDFARFLGESTAPSADDNDSADETASLNAFLHRIVAPHVTAKKDPQQAVLVAAADEAIGAMMREVLHHPDFQALESLWRSLALIVTRVETDEKLQVVLMDVSAEEFAADLSTENELENTGLYKMLVEQPKEDEKSGPFSAVVGNYIFDRTPPHAELLGRVAKIAAQAQAPFVASLVSNALDIKPDDVHPLTQEAWEALRGLPEAAYLGLALPRFMLRLPYGKKTDPVDSFAFEEFTPKTGLRSMLWANPAVAVGLLLAETYRRQGEQMQVGSIASIDEMPYYCYIDKDGDQTALPCTERYITARTQEGIASRGFLPLLAVKNSPEIRVGIFRSVGGGGMLTGWWSSMPKPVKAPAPAPEPEAAAEEGDEATAATEETPAEETSTDEPAAETSTDTPAADAAGDPDLDALLASLSTDSAAPPAAEPDVDPELAKLLADLG